MRYFQRQALARSTRKTYRSGWRAFCQFCDQHTLSPCPASKLSICLFATSLSRKVGHSTVRTYLAAISYFHRRQGVPDPTSDNHQLQLVVKGIRRTMAEQRPPTPWGRSRRPISLRMLRQLCTTIPQMNLREQDKAMFISALTLAFFGCLRVSEFTYSRRCHNSNPQLRDISVSRGSLVFYLRCSKTDQFKKGTHIVLGGSSDGVTCPCRAMLTYLAPASQASSPEMWL